jgi:hypothetical protein
MSPVVTLWSLWVASVGQVIIGDQSSADFWEHTFKPQVPRLDIIIDDGGHKPQHQNATLIAAFPHLSAGGVYLCEE